MMDLIDSVTAIFLRFNFHFEEIEDRDTTALKQFRIIASVFKVTQITSSQIYNKKNSYRRPLGIKYL